MNTKTELTPEAKDFIKRIAKNAFEGFMIGTGITFWTFYILGAVANAAKK